MLPNAVLLPGVILPVHIFEPRYKRMIADVQEHDGKIAVCWARPHENAPVEPCEVACVGTIDVRRKYPDGRRDILVTGQARVRVQRFEQEVPYRTASCETLAMVSMADGEYKKRLNSLKKMFARWVFVGFNDAGRVIHHINPIRDLDALCNFIVHYFITDFETKQAYLEMDSLAEKSAKLFSFVENNAKALEGHINLLRNPSTNGENIL